jgi:hypothetical protein
VEHEIVAAANALPTTATPANVLASGDSLLQLDKLRAAIVQLEDYQQNGAPLLYRLGLYHGNSVLEAARRIYFDRFETLMLANTQANLVASFNALPAQPQAGADYMATYNPLKAYLITTSNPEKSTVEFLPPVLMQSWENGRTPDTDQQRNLAAAQFAFYAGELTKSNPLQIPPDTLAVTRARTYLNSFGGFERIYQSMITAANKTTRSIDFNGLYPGSSQTVSESHVVAGAFSKDGYTFMQDALAHPDRYFSGEVWVLGNQAPSASLDRAALTQQLTTRYVTDYETEWGGGGQAAGDLESEFTAAGAVFYGFAQHRSGKPRHLKRVSAGADIGGSGQSGQIHGAGQYELHERADCAAGRGATGGFDTRRVEHGSGGSGADHRSINVCARGGDADGAGFQHRPAGTRGPGSAGLDAGPYQLSGRGGARTGFGQGQ